MAAIAWGTALAITDGPTTMVVGAECQLMNDQQTTAARQKVPPGLKVIQNGRAGLSPPRVPAAWQSKLRHTSMPEFKVS
jgi:hypothetical protein